MLHVMPAVNSVWNGHAHICKCWATKG